MHVIRLSDAGHQCLRTMLFAFQHLVTITHTPHRSPYIVGQKERRTLQKLAPSTAYDVYGPAALVFGWEIFHVVDHKNFYRPSLLLQLQA